MTSNPRPSSWSICAGSSPWEDLFHIRLVAAPTNIPRRTDIDTPVPYRQNKHVLFGHQEGRCNGCRREFPFRFLEVEHIIPPLGKVARTISRTCSCFVPTAIG